MGAWGTAPFDNDDFGDDLAEVVGVVSASVEKQIKRKFDEASDPIETWAAIGLVIHFYQADVLNDEYNHLIDRALSELDRLRSAPYETYKRRGGRPTRVATWIDSWRDPAAMKRMLTKVEKVLNEMRGRHVVPVLRTLPSDDLLAVRRR